MVYWLVFQELRTMSLSGDKVTSVQYYWLFWHYLSYCLYLFKTTFQKLEKIFVLAPSEGLCCVLFIYPALCLVLCPEIETSSIDWAQLSKLFAWGRSRVQSPKRCFKEIKSGRWIISKRSIIVLIYHGHALLDLKSSIFWDITTCSPLKANRRFGGTCRFHLQGRRRCQERNQPEAGSNQSSETSVYF
jgi:hypothetical protein